jgi:uncharacterized protein (UPF0548 family)
VWVGKGGSGMEARADGVIAWDHGERRSLAVHSQAPAASSARHVVIVLVASKHSIARVGPRFEPSCSLARSGVPAHD